MAGIIELVLERDGHDQPWGFRLQGGADLAVPLSVQRVLVGTPADGMLRKGDVITKISCTETKNISHQQAADLFNSAGNQITVQLKRAGVQPAPVASASTLAPLVNGSPVPTPVPVPVSGGVPLPGIANTTLARPENPAVTSLPKTQFSLKTHFARQQKPPPQPTNLDTLSIQTQPYRTLPLLQPSAQPRTDLGKKAISHLKTQEDYFNMPREPQYVPQAVTARAKDDFMMKQKVTGTLQHIQQAQNPVVASSQLPPGVQLKQQYNSPLPLYSQENVQEVLRMQASQGLNPVHPVNKPQKHMGIRGLPLKYDPERSATWQAIREQENCQLITEHGPTKSKVYSI